MVHDFLVSPNYIAFTICPMLCDWERVKKGESYFVWDPSLPVMVAVIPRKEGVAGLRWFTGPVLGMETHTINAWEEDGHLNLDHFFTRSGWLSQFPHVSDPAAREQPPFAERWTVDLTSDEDKVDITRLHGQVGEMPVIDPRTLGKKTGDFFFGTSNPALGPSLEWGPKGPPFTCLCRFDTVSGELDYYYAGPDSAPEEPLFIPKSADAADGDGWLLSVVGRRAENRTDVVILDARNLAAGPVATIRLPCRIHEGFPWHLGAGWVAGARNGVGGAADGRRTQASLEEERAFDAVLADAQRRQAASCFVQFHTAAHVHRRSPAVEDKDEANRRWVPTGASAALLQAARSGHVTSAATVPLCLEYEGVCSRPEDVTAAEFSPIDLAAFLDAIVDLVEPVLMSCKGGVPPRSGDEMPEG